MAQRAKRQDKGPARQGALAKKEGLLPLRNDIVFKMTFGDARNTRILKAFLSAVLDLPEEEYSEIEVIDPHLRVGAPDEKLGILDVHVKTKDGKQIDVEIQIARTPFIEERITAYTAKMLGSQLSIGGKYAELKKVISVVILAYDLIKDSDHFHNKYMLYDAGTGSLFTNIIEIHTLEYQKIPAEADGADADEKTARLILWLKLIRAEREEDVKMLATKSPEIEEAYEVLKKLSESEEVRLLYESREKAIWDEQARLYGARKEGKEEGRKEGREEGKLEMAKNLLSRGVSPDIIAESSGLTPDAVQSLMNG
ncbi:MAG: Rpn family recombination-promoting nuclease/putative transposase [Synergistaceae bacterium]|nr:Rpn family recombination-promoting nuclease/putative transposase [Synergistaceae bacterium]